MNLVAPINGQVVLSTEPLLVRVHIELFITPRALSAMLLARDAGAGEPGGTGAGGHIKSRAGGHIKAASETGAGGHIKAGSEIALYSIGVQSTPKIVVSIDGIPIFLL